MQQRQDDAEQQDTTTEHWIALLDGDVEDSVPAAERAIEKARRELAEIERELTKAKLGQPYRRVGRIEGLQAGDVFAAFGALERRAQFAKVAGR